MSRTDIQNDRLGAAQTVGRVAGNVAALAVPAGGAAKVAGLTRLAAGGRTARVVANAVGGAAGGATMFVEKGGSR